jgi:hypothetical protein
MEIKDEIRFFLKRWFIGIKDQIMEELDELINDNYPNTPLILLKKIQLECLSNPLMVRRFLINSSIELGTDLYSRIAIIRESSIPMEIEQEVSDYGTK